MTSRTNLLGLTRPELEAWCVERGGKAFRARQLMHWMYKRGATDFDEMTDLAKAFRAQLATEAEIRLPEIVSRQDAADGTIKWELRADASQAFEMVYIPEEDRSTLCISSQVGCALDCDFCSTGKQGFNRNLTVAEIIGQLWHANRALLADGAASPWVAQGRHPITNVVMMGMGEPLANYDSIVAAMRMMLDDNAYGLSRRRVTLSTSGLVPAMDRLREDCPVALAVSLHASNDAVRDALVPINRKYPIAQLLAACLRYIERAPRDFVTFEYVMLDHVNDEIAHAQQLTTLVRDVPCKFNLIPFNPFPNTEFRTSSRNRIVAFQRTLQDAGLIATIRKTRGDDIDAACGQLAGEVRDRTRRAERREARNELQPERRGPETAAERVL